MPDRSRGGFSAVDDVMTREVGDSSREQAAAAATRARVPDHDWTPYSPKSMVLRPNAATPRHTRSWPRGPAEVDSRRRTGTGALVTAQVAPAGTG